MALHQLLRPRQAGKALGLADRRRKRDGLEVSRFLDRGPRRRGAANKRTGGQRGAAA
jgi:hypothetical protein